MLEQNNRQSMEERKHVRQWGADGCQERSMKPQAVVSEKRGIPKLAVTMTTARRLAGVCELGWNSFMLT